MFDNPEKLFILFVIALLIFGPSKLASLGSSLGRSIRDFRSAVRGAQDEFRSAVREHVDAITPALPSPESMSLDTSMPEYGPAAADAPVAPAAEPPSAYSADGETAARSAAGAAGHHDVNAASAPLPEDDPASLASEPTAQALRESLSR
jgi:sec-independent protein translocase protein TatA